MMRLTLLGCMAIAASMSLGCERPEPAPVTSDVGSAPVVPPSPPVPPTAGSLPPGGRVVETEQGSFVEVTPPIAPMDPAAGKAEETPFVEAPLPETPTNVAPTDTSEAPSETPPTVAAGAAAFLAANQVVEEIQNDMHTTLVSVRDDETARAAAAKLPGLVDRWETTSKSATALFLTLSGQDKTQALQQLQNSALERMKNIEAKGEDMLESVQRIAKSPQRPIMESALLDLRDTMLAQHSIYAPRTLREHLEKKLGAAGTPLPR